MARTLLTRSPLWRTDSPIRVGVSACLLGERVRWDGGHKRDSYLADTLAPFVEWYPVCPEVEMGLGIPRQTLRLERHAGAIRLIMPATGEDHTGSLHRWAKRRLDDVVRADLSGYILKKDSPSCGMERVRVHQGTGSPTRNGRGLFAQALAERVPLLPLEEEGRLCDASLRESFVERVFAYRRLRDLFASRWKVGDLVAFHAAHKLQLMAHSTEAYRRLGRLVAEASKAPRRALEADYSRQFMTALAEPATPRRHVNVLQHMQGYVSRALDPPQRRELEGLIEDYRRGLLPLIVPITLVRHHVNHLAVSYLEGQTYLEPHPRELMLRNHC